MRVLHIGKFYPPFAGGIEHFMADLISVQRAQGIEASALVHDHTPPPWWRVWQNPKPCPDNSAPIYRCPCYGRILYAPISPLFPWWLSRIIKQEKPDVLHLHLPNTSAFFALLSPAARRIPWVIHWHSDVLASKFDKRLDLLYSAYKPWEQALLKRAKSVLVTSPPYLAASESLKPWHDKTQVIPLGLADTNTPSVTEADKAWATKQWQEQGLKVLQVGRLTYYKGQTVLLEALAQTQGIEVLIAGTGELKDKLAQHIETLNISDKARLLGFVSSGQLQALFASCDCFCLPSIERTEAFGVVLLEAMRYRKPLLVSKLTDSGMSWVVEAGKTGALVEPNNPEALAKALIDCYDNPERWQQWGQTGFGRLQQVFSLPTIAKDINKQYQRALDAVDM